MAADQRAQLQNYTHQLGQRDSEFAAMRQRMDDLRYFQTAGGVWRISLELMDSLKATSQKLVCCPVPAYGRKTGTRKLCPADGGLHGHAAVSVRLH